MVRRRFGFHVRERDGEINPRVLYMGDLSQTCLFIMAHRANS
jgi:hypothetical protein